MKNDKILVIFINIKILLKHIFSVLKKNYHNLMYTQSTDTFKYPMKYYYY